MESWITVVVAAIVAVSTLGAAFLQNWFSHKKFEKELEKAKQEAKRHRRWEVRSEPLLKLRSELAIIADKLDRAATTAHKLNIGFGQTEEEVRKDLQHNIDEVNIYVTEGKINQILFMQFDKELRDSVQTIFREYRESYYLALSFKQIKATEIGKAIDMLKNNADKIVEVQEKINKHLEEL